MTPGLTPEQVLLIADEFCDTHRVTVDDFSALVAVAAVPGARIDGVPVHADANAAAGAFSSAVEHLEPLSGRNREFAVACREVYIRYARQG